jgi:hypothetical protein
LASDNPWQKLIVGPEFQDAIDKNGYYESNLSFQPFVKKYELTLKSRAPAYLSSLLSYYYTTAKKRSVIHISFRVI